jgi:hypothetical protein
MHTIDSMQAHRVTYTGTSCDWESCGLTDMRATREGASKHTSSQHLRHADERLHARDVVVVDITAYLQGKCEEANKETEGIPERQLRQ